MTSCVRYSALAELPRHAENTGRDPRNMAAIHVTNQLHTALMFVQPLLEFG